MRIPILLLLFFTITTCSDLSSIVSDLSTLSRITNAIALQNAVLQNTLNLPEVVAELLSVDEKVFSVLVGLNTTFVMAEYKKFYDTIKSIPDRQLKNKKARRFRRSVAFLKANMNDFVKLEQDGRSFNAKKIIDLLKAQANPVDNLPCHPWTLMVLSNFVDLISEKKKVKKFVEKKYLFRVKEYKTGILNCFGQAMDFKNAPRDAVYQELLKMRAAFDLAKVLLDYEKAFKALEQFSGILKDVVDDVKATSPLDGLTNKIGAQILEAVSKNLEIYHRKFHPIPALTSGFPEGIPDIVRVGKDLKSPFFGKISRGKGIGALEKSLGDFFELSEHMSQLQGPWSQLFEPQNIADLQDSVGHVLKSLILIEETPPTSESLKILESAKLAMNECWKDAKNISRDPLRVIRYQYDLAAEVLDDMDNVVEHTELATSSMDFATFDEIFGFLLQEIPVPVNFDEEKVEGYKNKMRKIPRFGDIMQVFENLGELNKAQSNYVNALRMLQNHQNSPNGFQEDTFNLEGILKEANLLKIMTCLAGKTIEPEKLENLEKFLKEVDESSSKNDFRSVQGFLERVEKVRGILWGRKMKRRRRKRVADNSNHLTLSLNESQTLTLHLSEGLSPLRQMILTRNYRDLLLNSTQYSPKVMKKLQSALRPYKIYDFWKDPAASVGEVLRGLDVLNEFASNLSSDLKSIREIFKEAEKVPGIAMYEDVFDIRWILDNDAGILEFQEAMENARQLRKWDLDFAKNKKSLSGAYMVVRSLSGFFDEIFGFVKKPNQQQVHGPQKHVIIEPSVSYWAVVGMCFGFFALCILIGVIGYGFTKNGRTKYWNTYLYYFPSDKEFEKRWRYSLFMDRENGQNALIDASREINSINVKNILERGAYVNVYSPFGNTALHMATKRGFPKVVELLIRNGADRSLVNAQNLIAEQTIPANYRETRKEEADKYAQIEAIYEATRNKKYRIRVPQQMPSHLFHIYIESRTDNSLTNKFTEKYPGITSDEPLPTTTHCICKTSDSGILETDDVDLLAWIFLGVIMVKESWMADCVRDDKMIRRDDKHLIEDVQFHGTLYENCVGQWSQAMAKGAMPYLYGAYFVFVMKDLTRVPTLTMIINTLGGVFLEEFAAKDTFNAGACPYLHTNLGPAFVIHDGQTDLSGYKNDKMYTLFTDTQFIGFLLKRDIHRDTSPNPIPQLAE